MPSVIVALADAAAAELSAAEFSVTFAPVRSYRPQFTVQELETLRVSVVPRSEERAAASRKLEQIDCKIDIGVQKKLAGVGAAEIAEIDGLMGLVEEIKEHFTRCRWPAMDSCVVGVTNDPIYVSEFLGEMRVFTSVVTLEIQTMRAVQ